MLKMSALSFISTELFKICLDRVEMGLEYDSDFICFQNLEAFLR